MDNSKIQLDAQPVLVYNFNKHLLVFLKPFSAGTELLFFFKYLILFVNMIRLPVFEISAIFDLEIAWNHGLYRLF
jgi:hypothetical protein